MKIAIIGAGISGLSSALFLSKDHDVVLYEENDRLGGHAHTLHTEREDKKITVDNGFMVYNPERYPNFVALLDWLGVDSMDTTMTFSVDIENQISFRGNFPNGIFADRRNLFRLRFWRFLLNVKKFQKLAKAEISQNPSSDETIGSFFERKEINKDVASWFLYPMLSAIWSMPDSGSAANFPALASFTFLNNHKLLDQLHPQWKTIRGGSENYVKKLEERLLSKNVIIHKNTPVQKVTRKNNHVVVSLDKSSDEYDAVVFATHADVTKKILVDCDKDEDKALSYFTYSKNQTILHTDTSQLSTNGRLHAAWNYRQSSNTPAVFTYNMNILQHIPNEYPTYVTLNPAEEIPKKYILSEEWYSHPRYNVDSLRGQRMIEKLQGHRRTYYTGAHLGYGFHEDGIASAVKIAKKLKVKLPWER